MAEERNDDAGSHAVQADEARADAAQGDDAKTDEERGRVVIDELRRLKAEDLAVDMAVSLVTVGYQKLGLTEQTRELRDLGGARLSIELLRAILDVLEREGAATRLGDLRGTLAAMQMNYARAVADEAGTGAGRAAAADGDGEADAGPGPGDPEADAAPGPGDPDPDAEPAPGDPEPPA